jgi:NADPH-dependent glutamate synthase beta subunit-like oxidoreductase
MEEVPGSEKFFPAQLVFLALGFLGPQNEVLRALGIKQDARSNIQTPPKVINIFTLTSIKYLSVWSSRNTRLTSKASSLLVIAVAVNH